MKAKEQSWLGGSMMNLLVDYYTEIQFRPYGSGCTKANTIQWLKDLELGYLCIYVKGHSGYTSWRSSLRTGHRMLGQDMPKFFREVTREAGCKLVLYYSGLLDGIAGLRHPDWVMQDPDGKPKIFFGDFKSFISYGICPLSAYWDEWVSVHLRELFENYDPDGIWVDGDWPGPCYCPRCQARFRDATGWDEAWPEARQRPDFDVEYTKVWKRIEHEWRMRFCAFVKAIKPDALYSAGNVSPRREFAAPFDWRSGDFFSPGFFDLHDMSRMMRWYGTLGTPADAYICDTNLTHARKTVRSRSKPFQRMLQEAATVAAAGGMVGYWTYPLGNGALVPSRMKKAVAVRRFLKERESIFLHSESVPWTAIVVTDPAAETFGGNAVVGAHKMLAMLHRSPQVMDETGLREDMPHDLLVLPEQPRMDDRTVKQLENFVRKGGKLLSSGSTIRSALYRKLLGISAVHAGALADGHVFLKNEPFGEPTGIDSPWDRLDLAGAEELYPLYLSWDQFNPECRNLDNNWPMHGQVDEQNPEPAGFAAAITRQVGKGRIVHVNTEIFAKYRVLGDPQMLRWIQEIIEFLQPKPLFATEAPSWVDVSLRRKGERLLIHFVNQNPGRDLARLCADDVWADEMPEIGPYPCAIRLPRPPKAVISEPGGTALKYEFANGVLRVQCPRFHIHTCIAI